MTHSHTTKGVKKANIAAGHAGLMALTVTTTIFTGIVFLQRVDHLEVEARFVISVR